MGQADSLRRVRSAIIEVMDENNIPHRDDFKRSRPAIIYTVNGQDRIITYSGGDPRAFKNARTQTKRALQSLGVVLLSKPFVEKGVVAMDKDESHHTDSPAEPPVFPSQSQPNHNGSDYILFSSKKYQLSQVRPFDGHFIAIVLDRDLMAAKGDVLVIPTHLPNVVWDMPEPEFRSCFVQLAAPEQNQSDQSPSSRPRIEEPVYQSAQTDSNQPSDIAESDDSIVDDEAIESEEAIATNEEIEIEQPDTEELAVSEEYDEPSFDDAPAVFPSSSSALRGPRKIRRAGGISPQMGRILVAMHHLAANGQRDVLTNSIQGLVSPVDSKQVSGMIHGAIKAGYVDKGDSATGRASYYSLTKSGKKLAENLGTWPWDVREMAYPPWLSVEQLANA